MPFGDVTDKNAQRAEQTAVPALQAGGSVQNQTLEGMGLQTVSGATKTAQALGALAQDVVGNASALVQKEQYVEAYANAGAGRSIKEMRDAQPAFSTLFGPSATVQGAQARALQTATANFGNEALSMVDKFKDKAPHEFHKMLAAQLGSHLTGDGITDTLITQKATESITEIAATHYKAHAKYTQELNVQATTDSINSTVKLYKTMLATPADVRSQEGLDKAGEAVGTALQNTYGMDAISFQSLVVGIMNNDLRSGSTVVRDRLLPSLAPSVDQETTIQAAVAGYDKDVKAVRDGKVKQDASLAKLHKPKANPDIVLTPEEEAEYHDAVKAGDTYMADLHRDKLALVTVSLKDRMASGKIGIIGAMKEIHQLEKETSSTLSKPEVESIIGTHVKKVEGDKKLSLSIENYLAGNEDALGQQAYLEGLKQRNPGMPGERLAIDAIVKRAEDTPNAALEYQYAHLGKSTLDGGKPNEAFQKVWPKFLYHYGINKANALKHIKDPATREQIMIGMQQIELGGGLITPDSLVKEWSSTKSVSSKDILADEGAGVAIKDAIKSMSGDAWYNPFGLFQKKTKMTTYDESAIAQLAAYKARSNNRDYASAVAVARQTYEQTNESINGHYHYFGATPFSTQMGLVDKTVDTDTVLQHYKEKRKLDKVVVTTEYGNMRIQPLNKAGFDKGPEIVVSLKELGNIYNTEVTNVLRGALATAQGKTRDEKYESRVSAEMFRLTKEGYKNVNRDMAISQLNKHDAGKQKFNSSVQSGVGAVGAYAKSRFAERVGDIKVLGKAISSTLKSFIPNFHVEENKQKEQDYQ